MIIASTGEKTLNRLRKNGLEIQKWKMVSSVKFLILRKAKMSKLHKIGKLW